MIKIKCINCKKETNDIFCSDNCVILYNQKRIKNKKNIKILDSINFLNELIKLINSKILNGYNVNIEKEIINIYRKNLFLKGNKKNIEIIEIINDININNNENIKCFKLTLEK